MKKLKPIFFAGTTSDAGKSLISTAFCRILKKDGYNPAPFKAQNMALNSYVTYDGCEIGMAQAVQAMAAGIIPNVNMNPVLLKPNSTNGSQLVLMGKPIENIQARSYYQENYREKLFSYVSTSFDNLNKIYNPIVMEGAGSFCELNLMKSDITNGKVAEYADASVFLVADIEKGGVFASVFGTINLLPENFKKLVKGIIINKFHGSIEYFHEGKKILEEICKIPVVGIIPFFREFKITDEDSVALSHKPSKALNGKINIVVIKLPTISNFSDFTLMETIENINLYYSDIPEEIEKADIIILPGCKSTISDLKWLKKMSLDTTILKSHSEGKTILGICGGFQMLGNIVEDPSLIEGCTDIEKGLALFNISTIITSQKELSNTDFNNKNNILCHGYEIHMGITDFSNEPQNLNRKKDGSYEGIVKERVFGTYFHDYLNNKAIIEMFMAAIGRTIDFDKSISYNNFDLLAESVRRNCDMDLFYKLVGEVDA
ncbi:MAG: cobyric acid synthase [Candidatus Delongbacteria bacterium]|nr:cobyric acid synthase [Candidatus Delongbacteria bacterium]MBN2835038.1 cobyric acid synthase [Candidatus Delongbacteria bacterium]